MTPSVRQIVLPFEGHVYVFRYRPGQEVEMVTQLAGVANDREYGFGWHEAAVVAFHMGKRMEEDLMERAS